MTSPFERMQQQQKEDTERAIETRKRCLLSGSGIIRLSTMRYGVILVRSYCEISNGVADVAWYEMVNEKPLTYEEAHKLLESIRVRSK